MQGKTLHTAVGFVLAVQAVLVAVADPVKRDALWQRRLAAKRVRGAHGVDIRHCNMATQST